MGLVGFILLFPCLRYTLTGQTHYVQRAHFFILLGLFLIFDGRVARLRNKSSMGQELDSLADLVSFGYLQQQLPLLLIQNNCRCVIFGLGFYVD